jgi:hypothetical protein
VILTYRLDVHIRKLANQPSHYLHAVVNSAQEYRLIPDYHTLLKQMFGCLFGYPRHLIWMVEVRMETDVFACTSSLIGHRY